MNGYLETLELFPNPKIIQAKTLTLIRPNNSPTLTVIHWQLKPNQARPPKRSMIILVIILALPLSWSSSCTPWYLSLS